MHRVPELVKEGAHLAPAKERRRVAERPRQIGDVAGETQRTPSAESTKDGASGTTI